MQLRLYSFVRSSESHIIVLSFFVSRKREYENRYVTQEGDVPFM